jgi:predicted RNA-binding protein with PUA-like domain
MNYWLMKSEPYEFSIDDLKRVTTEPWSGVRNYLARNYLRQMAVGDKAFFYHSSCEEPGIVGIMTIAKAAYPDATAGLEAERWSSVDVRFEQKFSRAITLTELKKHAELANFTLLQRGNRLSIMPVSTEQWTFINGLA